MNVKIRIHKNNIKYETLKAMLIKMPSKSKYKDFQYWIPKCFYRNKCIILKNSFKYILRKMLKNGKFVEKEISFYELLEAYDVDTGHIEFGEEIIDDLKD